MSDVEGSADHFASIARPESLASVAYGRLRDGIRDRKLVAGIFYSEAQLAEAFGISRTPVREAVLALAKEGIVETVPKRGFRLRTLDENEEQEVFDLRSSIESYVVKKLAEERSPDDIEVLRDILRRQAKVTDDPSAFLSADEEFHMCMPSLLGLERTHQMLASLRGAIYLAGAAALSLPDSVFEILLEHQRVVDAIESGDKAASEEAILTHIRNTAQRSSSRRWVGDQDDAASAGED